MKQAMKHICVSNRQSFLVGTFQLLVAVLCKNIEILSKEQPGQRSITLLKS